MGLGLRISLKNKGKRHSEVVPSRSFGIENHEEYLCSLGKHGDFLSPCPSSTDWVLRYASRLIGSLVFDNLRNVHSAQISTPKAIRTAARIVSAACKASLASSRSALMPG